MTAAAWKTVTTLTYGPDNTIDSRSVTRTAYDAAGSVTREVVTTDYDGDGSIDNRVVTLY